MSGGPKVVTPGFVVDVDAAVAASTVAVVLLSSCSLPWLEGYHGWHPLQAWQKSKYCCLVCCQIKNFE